MKLSKSIVIFPFFSSFLSAFLYSLDRTGGNGLKSLHFALYFLAIKIGLIAPNIPLELNQDQSNQQLVSSLQPRPIYNPYVSVLDDYRSSGLYMSNIEQSSLVPQRSHSREVINELRAGDSRLRQAAWLFIKVWMLQHQSVDFQTIRQAPPPPHHQLFGGTSSFPRNNYFSKSSQTSASLHLQKPSDIPQAEYNSLTGEQRRNLPYPRYGFIMKEGHPPLVVRYGQVKYKTPTPWPNTWLINNWKRSNTKN